MFDHAAAHARGISQETAVCMMLHFLQHSESSVKPGAGNAAPGEILDEDEKDRIDALIEDVEESRPPGSERPLENPLIFGNFQVAYVSTRKAPKQEGQREIGF